jgi:hypothetical protein
LQILLLFILMNENIIGFIEDSPSGPSGGNAARIPWRAALTQIRSLMDREDIQQHRLAYKSENHEAIVVPVVGGFIYARPLVGSPVWFADEMPSFADGRRFLL